MRLYYNASKNNHGECEPWSYRFGELKEQIKKVFKTIQNDDVKGGGNQGGGGN